MDGFGGEYEDARRSSGKMRTPEEGHEQEQKDEHESGGHFSGSSG